ncbi:hypothetical protein ABB37_05561 [Leptomonas pyrrhocoris]|uniref:Uncharacterized protein n=1 Tax=Leptomonas pyrrhocoris TaxID=157538 RepID=A0A0N0DUK7_LEPPY|nr:hypothetical protein ABB37_05561 [Leptomonas pyrrhocoris]KPA79022.1 hypothetical protein ABB37_05561 [Leptomonas pyrrhocoris]|eukprot:XP_015657461.1 hypothetical protein ABB37_05561 [Leptomonas pyrrhocoris]
MTTDTSPVNHYLLFDRADEFDSDAKVDYALRHHRLFTSKGGGAAAVPASLSVELDRRMLIRTFEELKRGVCYGDRTFPATPSTGNTFNTNISASSSPDYFISPQFESQGDGDVSNAFFDGTDDLDAKPWDNTTSSQSNYWNWPMEVLYQSYHLWIALDYGRDVFSITRNGVVLVDRIPTVVATLLQVVETTLFAREQDMQQIRLFVEANIADEQTRTRLLRQVWDPTVYVSIVLLNVPQEVEQAVPFEAAPPETHAKTCGGGNSSSNSSGGGAPCMRPRQPQHPAIIMYPPEHRRFTALETAGDDASRCSAVTLLSHCDARVLLDDGSFMDRLRDLLTRYENAYREHRSPQEWPQSSLSASIEYLTRAMPDASDECNTIVFVSDVGTMSSSDTLTFLESMVRRKSLIVSLVALNRILIFDSPELSPLARFLSAVGGFAVHVDYWLALGAHRLNSEWCHKFEGARCLAQQVFVHLINRFPVASPGATRRDLLADALCEPVALYDGDHDLPDFVAEATMVELLSTTAALRFNQGWSVLIDYHNETSAASHLAARYDHDFHCGAISLHYEMNINRPAVYRRLLVSGTKALVDHFCKKQWDENSTSVVSEGSGHWLAYLTLLRLQVHLWMKAEQVLMRMVNTSPLPKTIGPIPDLQRFSGAEGVLSEWFNTAMAVSIGVFFRFEYLPPSTLVAHSRAASLSGAATESAARACLRSAMLRRHCLVGREEELTYLRVVRASSASDSCPLVKGGGGIVTPSASAAFSLVQFFPLYNTAAGNDFGLAGGFECRVSCVLCDREQQRAVVQAVLTDIFETVKERNAGTARKEKYLLVRASHRTENEEALQLVKASLSQRRMRMLTSYTEGIIRSCGGDRSGNGESRDGSTTHSALLEQCYRCPMLTFPWSLLNALCFRWILGCSEYYPYLTEEAFGFFVSRRLHAGFVLVVYYTTSLKAVLMRRIGNPETQMDLCVFDVLEALPATAAPSAASPIFIRRLVTPFKRARSSVWAYTHDIQEDLHIATALFTCKAFSSNQPGERRTLPRQMRERGYTPVTARVESLLHYLHSKYTEVVELRSPPSLGVDGCVQLRDRLLNIVSCVGDRSTVVAARALHADYAQLLSSGKAVVDPETNVYISVISPMRYNTILCVLMLESDTDDGTRQHTVKVALAALDQQLLEHTLAQQYLASPSACSAQTMTSAAAAAMAKSVPPECVADRAVVLSLRHLLTVFTSVYCARELLRLIRIAPDEEASAPVSELADTYRHLGNYAAEIDATHLLHVVLWRYGAGMSAGFSGKMQEVLMDVVAAHQRSFPTHPTLWLPLSKRERSALRATLEGVSVGDSDGEGGEYDDDDGDGDDGTEEDRDDDGDGGERSGHVRLDLLPVAVKVCAVLQASSVRNADGDEAEAPGQCLWISSASASSAASNNALRENTLRDSTPWFVPSAAMPAETCTLSDATVGALTDRNAPPTRLLLRVFLKTVPIDLLELCKDESFCPPQSAVRRTLRLLFYRFTAEEGPVMVTAANAASKPLSSSSAPASAPSHITPSHRGTAEEAAGSALDRLFAQPAAAPWDRRRCDDVFRDCNDFGSLPEYVERSMRGITSRLAWRIATYCLQSACCCTSFTRLQSLVMTGRHGGSDDVDSVASSANKDASASALRQRDAMLSHAASLATQNVRDDTGLRDLLRVVVTPALLSSRRFIFSTFPIEFTQHATTFRSVDPVAAAQDVFRRCVDEDWMWVLPTTHFAYIVVPNRLYFGKRWVLVHVEMQLNHTINRASILCYDADDNARQETMRAYSKRLRAHVYNKITQVSQLHLLKQLRDTQNASGELIPPAWGDQFSQGSPSSGGGYRGSSSSGGSVKGTSALNDDDAPLPAHAGRASSFYLRGCNVLEVPIYYKLQHQCKKILSRIQTNSSRLELITIYNRDQCFVVADDEEGDTFHYVRLVFVKDLANTVSVATRSPLLTSSERCPQLVVQLFSATSNAKVQRPLQKLQDFCYFLAVQELQGHLNYVQHKMISFNDLVFLQNQRLESVLVDLRTIFNHSPTSSASDGQAAASFSSSSASNARERARQAEMALSLLFLNLREYKFKPFGIQDEPTHATSNFVEHYNLEKSLKLESTKEAGSNGNGGGADGGGGGASGVGGNGTRIRIWRFVKIVEGPTDVLVSCCLLVNPAHPDVIVLDRYLTKIPAERYINGDSENTILAHLSHCVEETMAQLRFFAFTAPGQPAYPLVRSTLRTTTSDLLHFSPAAFSKDSSVLRFHHFPLDNVNPTVLPMLVDRLCGALANYAPTCFTYAAGHGIAKGVVHVPGFSWQWVEGIQNDSLADHLELYITCGYTVMDSPESTSGLPPTRVVPYVVPGVPITAVTTGESQMSLLGEYQLCEGGCPLLDYRILVSISLTDGLSLAIFNLRDTDYIVRLLGYVVQEMAEKSALMEDVLLQRLGYAIPSSFNEADLARNCCGDDTNVIRSKALRISSDVYRRRVNNVRFRVRPDAAHDEPLVVILEGLYNRGLIVNYDFAVEDAMKVLYDECPQYTLPECVRILDGLIATRLLTEDPQSVLKPQMSILASLPQSEQLKSEARTCRLTETTGVPADALIACGYHRHILAAHIIVEAQNARSGVAEVLARCDAVWRAGPQNNVLELAKAIVMLQLKSKEVFGARVADFSLRRERWRHEDDVLDPTLPTQTQQNMSYSRSVDASLQMYMEHLRQLYPSMCVIDLDPNDPLTTSDDVLLNRLRCRYGKVTNEAGDVVLFSPHLYYAVIPFVDLLRCPDFYARYHLLVEALGEEVVQSPITTGGLFIIEVGFQVVHYALDFFVISGNDVSPGVTAKVAADFKQTLLFESVLYDAAVRGLAQCMRAHSVVLSGQQKTHTAVANLVKYHPFPPMYCGDIVAAYTITDPRVMRLKNLTPGGTANNGDLHVGADGVLYLSPQKHNLLQREQTNEMYTYCGLIVWERAQLFVLLTNTRDVNKACRGPNRDLSQLVLTAKNLLLSQLLDSTQQERLDVAWAKFLYGGRLTPTWRGNSEREWPSYDEFELLRGHSHKIVLHSYVPVLQMILEPMEWTGDSRRLRAVCGQLFPEHVLFVIGRQRGSREGQVDTAAATPHTRHGDHHSPASLNALLLAHGSATGPPTVGGYDVHRLFMSRCVSGWFVVTFASGKGDESGCFLAMECFSDPRRPFGASIVVEELSLYCKPSRTPQQHSVMTFLSEEEQMLAERFVRLINSAVWSSIVPCTSQFMV